MALDDEVKKYRFVRGSDAPATGSVTSREQIIDPYSVVDVNDYGLGRRGQANYKQALASASRYAEQQEAAYQEWYNSPEQVAARERAAGRNPDLTEPIGGDSADTAPATGTPLDGIPTNGEVATQVISGVASVVGSLSSIASLATAFTDIPLKAKTLSNLGIQGDILGLAKEEAGLKNLNLLKTSVSSDIGDLLATAMQTHLDSNAESDFDLDSWFADPKNFEPLDKIYSDNPRYSSVLSSQKSAMLRHYKNAVGLQKESAQNSLDFGFVASDPRLTPSQKLTILQLKPYTEACVAADKSVAEFNKVLNDWNMSYYNSRDASKIASAENAISDYNSEYYTSLDGKVIAAFEQLVRDSQSVSYNLEKSINQGYLDMFNNDPTGVDGWRAAYLYGSHGGSSWNEAYISHSIESTKVVIDSIVETARATGDVAHAKALLDAFSPILSGVTTHTSDWQNNSLGWSLWRKQMKEYINSCQKLLDSIE